VAEEKLIVAGEEDTEVVGEEEEEEAEVLEAEEDKIFVEVGEVGQELGKVIDNSKPRAMHEPLQESLVYST